MPEHLNIEGVVAVRTINLDPKHIAYRNRRNVLIPVATKYANIINGKPPHQNRMSAKEHHKARAEWGDAWNKTFFHAMHVLAVGSGLEKCSGCSDGCYTVKVEEIYQTIGTGSC